MSPLVGRLVERLKSDPRYERAREVISLRSFKPILANFETHLVDHCNMKCAGCGHYSPLSDKWFADPAQFDKDMRRLSELFSLIKKFRLMGGEPLLHPDIESFIEIGRRHCPGSEIRIVTNGILLPAMKDSFWRSCVKNNVELDVTAYPPTRSKVEGYAQMARSKGVAVWVTATTSFAAYKNPMGDSNPEDSFRLCRTAAYCPFLRNGVLYVCAEPAMVHLSEQLFDRFPSDGGIAIHTPGLRGQDVLATINKPGEICRYCSVTYRETPWTTTQRRPEEWVTHTDSLVTIRARGHRDTVGH